MFFFYNHNRRRAGEPARERGGARGQLLFDKCHRSVELGSGVGDGKRFICLVEVFNMLIYSSSGDNQAPTASLFTSTSYFLRKGL